MNPFEAGERKVIPAVLIYVQCGGKFLMLHRDAPGRPADHHRGKWNGLGGKCEADESFLETAKRELREESGLDLPTERFRPLGTLQFPLFKLKKNEDWVVMVFRVDAKESDLSGLEVQGPEGSLHWIAAGDLMELNLWAGDRQFLPYVVAGKPFAGTLWYRDQELLRSWIQPLTG